MSCIFMKSNVNTSPTETLINAAFGGGGRRGRGGRGRFWSSPRTICSAAANVTTYGFSASTTTVAGIGGTLIGGPIGGAAAATTVGIATQSLSGDIYNSVYNDCMGAFNK